MRIVIKFTPRAHPDSEEEEMRALEYGRPRGKLAPRFEGPG